jgi:polysaccharide export outer membrane protein
MSQISDFTRGTMTLLLSVWATVALAQQAAPTANPSGGVASVSTDFQIGPEDVVGINFWREKEMSGDVTVRPDGFISLPLLGEIRAAGLSPSALAKEIQAMAGRYLTEPNVTVAVRQVNSRKVYITGEVANPGAYALTGPLTIVQLIALAGGFPEYARTEAITLLREEQGRILAFRFNFEEVARGRRLDQNIQLQPGDTIIVP